MSAGTLGNIDLALIALYAFWVFFAGLIWYLRQEDRREGYPLETDVGGHFNKDPWLFVPQPKTFLLPHGGGEVKVPNDKRDSREIAATRPTEYPGAPLYPTGDPMADGVGPAAWAERSDTPDLAADGSPRIVPLRVAGEFYLDEDDPNPIGMEVKGADSEVAGKITDVWVDRSEYLMRYYQVDIGSEGNAKQVLLPVTFGLLRGRGDRQHVYVHAITSEQFGGVPGLASMDQVTRLEEEKIVAYYGGGQLYATPQRQEPLL